MATWPRAALTGALLWATSVVSCAEVNLSECVEERAISVYEECLYQVRLCYAQVPEANWEERERINAECAVRKSWCDLFFYEDFNECITEAEKELP